jgi:hypothetical protein
MSNLQVGAPMPSSIGLCADEYHRVRELRLAMQKETDAVKAREDEIETHIINNLSAGTDTGAAGLLYRAQIKSKTVPKIGDWSEFTFDIWNTKRFDLIQKRASIAAIEEMWSAGETVPGIDKVHLKTVSITKI